MIIFGFKTMLKALMQTQLYTCTHCNNTVPFNIVRARKWFTLFWIPVIPYSTKYYLTCSICENGYELTKDLANEMLASAQGQMPLSQ